jgi:hypothetical protein
VWTGREMVVWGGIFGEPAGTGGRYDPGTDQWLPTSPAGAPAGRDLPVGVWTGSHVIVWGGSDGFSRPIHDSGGAYALGHTLDDDGDGRTECAGDCNDGHADVWQAAGEAGSLAFGADKTTLSWQPPVDPGSVPGLLRYEVLRSDAADAFDAATCLALATPSSTSVADATVPALSAALHYLVRAASPCTVGEGPLGEGAGGSPREGSSCP